jgi:hypothetical protein
LENWFFAISNKALQQGLEVFRTSLVLRLLERILAISRRFQQQGDGRDNTVLKPTVNSKIVKTVSLGNFFPDPLDALSRCQETSKISTYFDVIVISWSE